jgi:phosphatidylglycerol---prolipoprotein diacylglyceryl transferase
MHPILFKIGNFAVYSWGAALLVSIVVGIAVSRRRAPRFGVAPEAVRDVATIILITSLIGSRIWYILYHLDGYQGHWDSLRLTGKGGMVGCSGFSMMGGIVLVLLGSWIYARITRISFLAIGDVIAPAFLLGSGIQRLGGCFLSGCCFGLPTESVLGMVFPKTGDAGAHFPGIPLWPAQLIASALGFAGYALVLWLERRHRFPGYSFCLVFIYYPLERLLVDQFRYYEPAQILGTFGPLTFNVNHPLLLGLFALSAALRLGGRLRRAASPT